MIYLQVAIIFLFIIALSSIVWYTLRTGISPMPSSKPAQNEILAQLKGLEYGKIVECGSGWGGLACALATQQPNRQVVGYELSPLPWLVSFFRKMISQRHNLIFFRQDFLSADLSGADAIVIYLYPGCMRKIAHKLAREKHGIRMVISNTFALPGYSPDRTICLRDRYRTPIYIYTIEPFFSYQA